MKKRCSRRILCVLDTHGLLSNTKEFHRTASFDVFYVRTWSQGDAHLSQIRLNRPYFHLGSKVIRAWLQRCLYRAFKPDRTRRGCQCQYVASTRLSEERIAGLNYPVMWIT